MSIREFLLARIAEDELQLGEYKRIATQYSLYEDFGFGGLDDYLQVPMGYGRALAECAAKRAIVEGWDDPAFSDQVAYDAGYARAMDDAARALAAVHADHPDYQPEWGPEA